MTTSCTETLVRTLEKELGNTLKLTPNASVTLAEGTKRGYLTPQELTKLLVPVPFVGYQAQEKALATLTGQLEKAGISIFLEKKAPEEPPPEQTELSPVKWPQIYSAVLAAVSKECGFPVIHITGKSKNQKLTKVRHFVIYLMETDFCAQSTEVLSVFGMSPASYSNLYALRKKIEKKLETDTKMREQTERIRATYTLAWYHGNLREVLKRQKVLFPTQRKEAQDISLKLREKLESMVPLVARAAVPERNKEVFLVRYGLADDSCKIKTLQETGELYDGLTRERIRQILTHVWKKLPAGGETLPFGTTEALEETLEEYASWQELIRSSQ